MSNEIIQNLMTDIDAFCAKHKMAKSVFGRLVNGTPALWWRMQRGENITMRTIEKINTFMDEYKEKGEGVDNAA